MRKSPTGKEYQSHVKYSASGNPLTKFVNLCQTPEERRDKYAFCLFFGLPWQIANRLRDWHWTKINLFIEAYLKDPGLLTADGGPRAAVPSDTNN